MTLLMQNPLVLMTGFVSILDWVPAILWTLLAAAAVFLLARGWLEPLLLEVVTVPIPAQVQKPMRVLLICDIHAECLRLPPGKILKACARARPDLILFAGDLAGKEDRVPNGLDLLRQIKALPELAGCPFLAVRGNHDGSRTVAGLLSLGIPVLENEAVFLILHGETWSVIGLDDLKTGRPDAVAALKQAASCGVPPARRIVLAHNPDTLLDLPQGEAALFVCGHLHGGQIWLPFRLEFFLLRGEKLPRKGHVRGYFTWHGMPVYISRGLGCVLLPLRLFSKPEITILEFS
jgi:uncharacterized protein